MSEAAIMLQRLALCVVVAAFATTAYADDGLTTEAIARAEAYAAQAFDAYARANYAAAAALYQQALAAAPSADILYNLARIYDVKLRDRTRAIEYYSRYAGDTGAEPERVRAANARLGQLRELERAASEPPASAQRATAATVPLPAQSARTAPSPAPATANGAGLGAWQVTGVVTGAIGVVGLGVGSGFGLAAKFASDDAHADCDGNACNTQHGVGAARDAARLARASTIAFIAGGALTLVGATLVLFGAHSDSEHPADRTLMALSVQPDAVGAYVAGRW